MPIRKQGQDNPYLLMNNKDLSIIIVDDLQFSRIVVKTALEKAGYQSVRMADSALEALKMLDEQPAEVVLADWMMPEMDGLELTVRIRQRDEENGTYTGIILFTANEGIEYLVKAFEHGVDDYLRKPPNPLELAARVNSAARIAAMQNDLLETSRQMDKTIKHLEKASLTDDITNAGNHRFLTIELKSHLLEASSRKGGVSLAMVMLNELQNTSIEYGKKVEKEILISLYRRLRRTVRPTDTIARLDDNVFGIIMHHTQILNYKSSAMERVLNSINQRPFKTSSGNLALTASIGVHYYRGDSVIISVEEMIKKASHKLDLAKASPEVSIAH